MLKRLVASSIFVLILCLSIWHEIRRPDPLLLIPSLTGESEYCQTCHADVPEISSSHPEEVFGCVICHGGEKLALDGDLAHSTMRGARNPSDLTVVEASCGGSACHSGSPLENQDHIQRVQTSIQATYAGAIASVRFSFGAQQDLAAQMGIYDIQDNQSVSGVSSLAAFNPDLETHPYLIAFGDNCLFCHISANPLDGKKYDRLTGCAACHSPLNTQGNTHTFTTAIPYTQCNTCHNRGNYNLQDMQFHPREDQYTGRLHEYYQPIAQFVRCEYTLDCIDCHTQSEAMGDGDLHSSQAEIQYIQCQTCHGTREELPRQSTIRDENDRALQLARLNPVTDLKVGDTILVTEKGEPLWNTLLLPDGSYQLTGKATSLKLSFRAVFFTACEQKPDQQESRYCHQCHAADR